MSETDTTASSRMGKAIVRGVLFGLPAGIVGLTFAVFVFTDNTLVDSFATAILPGVLLGVFAGGFAGMAMTME